MQHEQYQVAQQEGTEGRTVGCFFVLSVEVSCRACCAQGFYPFELCEVQGELR